MQNWNESLDAQITKNYNGKSFESIPVALASVTIDGKPKIQTIQFSQFLKSDPNIILFSGSVHNPDLTAALSQTKSKSFDILMSMPTCKFTMTGKMYMVTAPTMSVRPTNIVEIRRPSSDNQPWHP
jgi:hypothetical protein